MLYEMLTGAPPFEAITLAGLITKHLYEAPPPLPASLDVPPALKRIVMRTLAKDPDARQQDATALACELQAII